MPAAVNDRHMAVAALLTQQRGGMPQRGQRIVRPRQRAIRGEQRSPVDGRLPRCLAGQFRCGTDVFIFVQAIAAQRRDRRVLPGPQCGLRAGDLPSRRQGLGDALGGEVVKDRGHQLPAAPCRAGRTGPRSSPSRSLGTPARRVPPAPPARSTSPHALARSDRRSVAPALVSCARLQLITGAGRDQSRSLCDGISEGHDPS